MYLGYFILGFAINFNWWWGCLDLIQDGVGSFRLKHRNMEDQVACMHAVQKPKSVRPGASLGNHFEGAKIIFSKLLQGPSGAEELRFDKCVRTNSELRSWAALGIGRDLIARLSELDLLFQLNM